MSYEQLPGSTVQSATGGQYNSVDTTDPANYPNLAAQQAAAAFASAQSAATSATTATTQAATATTQAGIATTAVNTIGSSVTTAATSASQAASSAATATTQATNAATSASTATTQASAASASASAAATQATDAASSATSAATQAASALSSANLATTQAAAASTNAASATTQAGIATTQAEAASTSASNAAASAGTATTQASDASVSASGASASSATAATSAATAVAAKDVALSVQSTVTASAVVAADNAAAAAVSAGISSTKANEANTSATSASTSAATASTAAATATTQAGIATTQAGIATTQATTAMTQAGIAVNQASDAAASAASALSVYGSVTAQQAAVTAAQTAATSATASADAAAVSAAFADSRVDTIEGYSDTALAASVAASASQTAAAASAASVQSAVSTATNQANLATTKANEAVVSADSAAASATTATAQANIATTQAGIAATQAVVSTTQATVATTQATNAAASAASAFSIYGSASAQQASVTAAQNAATSATASAAASSASANTSAGSAASALSIYGTAAAQQTALANAQAAASVAQGFAASAASVVQQDLSGVNAAALHRSPNAVTAMFLYDTSKDSDGGAWTEKCQHTSWYNEAVTGKWLGAQPSELAARNEGAVLGSELVSNGTFDTGTTGWTTTGTVLVDASGVTLTNTGAAYPSLRQTVAVTPGKVYRLVVKHRQNWTLSGGHFFSFYAGGTEIGASRINFSNTVTQTDVIYVTAPAGATAINFQINADNQDGLKAGTWDDISVREVTALTTSSNDYFQLTTDGKFYRLWKNLLSRSNEFDNAAWVKQNAMFTPNAVVAPDGNTTANIFIPSAVTATVRVYQGFSSTAGQAYTTTWFVKKQPGSIVRWLRLTADQSGTSSWFDLDNGVWGTSGLSTHLTVLADGWYRIGVTYTALTTDTSDNQFLSVVPADGVFSNFTGDGISGFYIWDAQSELGSTATAYEAKGAEGSTSEVFRGNKRKFPKLAGIVAEAGNVTIYDLTEPARPMWMRFVGSNLTNNTPLIYLESSGINGVAFSQSELFITCFGTTQAYGGPNRINFAADWAGRISGSSIGLRNGGVARRNALEALDWRPLTGGSIASQRTNAVAMTVLPDAPVDPVTGLKVPTIAVGTTGGVSVIQHTGIVNNIGTASNQRGVAFIGKMLVVEGVLGSGYAQWTADDVTKGSAAVIVGRYPGRFDNNSSVPAYLAVGRLGNLASTLNRVGNYKIALSKINREIAGKSAFAHITDTYSTGHMVGDIRRAYLADVDTGSVSGTELVTNGTFDTDLTGWTVITAPVVWGASGVADFGSGGLIGQAGISAPSKVLRLEISATIQAGTRGRILPRNFADSASLAILSGPSTAGYFLAGTSVFYFVGDSQGFSFRITAETGNEIEVDYVSIKEVVADRSYKAQGASITGTLTKSQVASAAQLVAYSGFSASNYLREPYSADLDFGTGEFSVGAWVNVPVTLPAASFPVIGSELVTNGAFDTDTTGWSSNNAGLSVVGGQLSVETFGSTGGAVQNIAVVIGKTYRISVGSVASLEYATFAGAAFTTFYFNYQSTPGTFFVTATNSTLRFYARRTGTGTGTIDNISVVEVGPSLIADRAHSSGAKVTLGVIGTGQLQATAFDGTTTRTVTTTAAYNTATWLKAEAQYKTDGSLSISVNGQEVAVTRGTALLTLDSRYNLLTKTEQFDDVTWTKISGGVVTANTTLAPNGTTTADTFTMVGVTSSIRQTQTLQIGVEYVYSIALSRVDNDWAVVGVTGVTDASIWVNLSTGELGTIASGFSSAFIEDVGGGWFVVTGVFTTTTGTNYTTVKVVTSNSTSEGADGKSVALWGADLRPNALASLPYQRVNTATDFDFQAPLTIGNSFAADAPFPGSIALLKASATVPTAEQSVWMYEQEKQMFRDGAQVTLPDAGSIVDLAYDDLTDKWLAVSATNESEFSGLVRTNVTAVPAGSYSKVTATSGIQLQARTTTNPGVDITIPAANLREELLKDAEAANRLNAQLAIFDYVGGFTANTTSGSTSIASAAGITYPVSYLGARVTGTGIPTDTFILGISGTTLYLSKAATATGTAVQLSFTDFILPVGYEAKAVLLAGAVQREGSTQAFVRLFDGFKEIIRLNTAPSNTALVQIQATRSIQ